MTRFLVTVTIHSGGYEKISYHIIYGVKTPEDAEYLALRGESHNTPLTRKQYDRGDEWWDDTMIYTINTVREIPEEDFIVLSKYM